MDIVLPDLGDEMTEGVVARWVKQEGETVAVDDTLLEIETDKVTAEVAAEAAGVLSKILVPAGKTVPVGTVLGRITVG